MWVTTASNHTIYQITPDGNCAPFKTIDIARYGSPRGIAFTPDGKNLTYVSGYTGNTDIFNIPLPTDWPQIKSTTTTTEQEKSK